MRSALLALAVFALHSLALGASYLAAMSEVAAHGPHSGPSLAVRAGSWGIRALGFPLLHLALALPLNVRSPAALIAAALATSGLWAAVAVLVARRARSPGRNP